MGLNEAAAIQILNRGRTRVPELVAKGDLIATTTSLVIKGFLDDGCTNFLGEDDMKVVP